MSTTDREIRAAFLQKRLQRLRDHKNTLIVEELGLVNATARVDIAVLNGCLHGFEIKSGRDTLERLHEQMQVYGAALEKLTVVCASRHLHGVLRLTPGWVGIVEAAQGARGAVNFSTRRRARANPNVSSTKVAHLLWRNEAADLLARRGESGAILRRPRAALYARLGEMMSAGELTAYARNYMLKRPAWRPAPSSD